ncbi:Signal transduction histidine kinase [Friedmanniella luteola]|uniref:histidine kinase n=1 Tax=Friedmanniella luteola TaxID=546871 RepID=A0A1H1WEJ8_9ACTN|nr:HAMP domain-containing sensor histidine kinase [Friedmanniella luteola]SDS95563.1 Signal transduction histidine kinase [Friedmanniella luteola]
MASGRDRRALGLGPQMGVRGRSVLVAVVVVLVAILIGGSGLVWALQANLEQAAESTASARAVEVVDRIAAEGLTATAASLTDRSRSGEVVQVLTADGRVVGASSRAADRQPLSPQRPAAGEYTAAELDLDFLDEGGEWEVVSTGVVADGALHLVQVGVPIRVQRETVQTVALFLLAGAPLLLGAVAVAVWVLVGRALRSVERIRATVAEIDARHIDDRVVVPPTRDEVAALAVTMNTMLDRLEASHQAQRAFVSDASHELRSPLATLTTAGELALRGDEPTRTRLLTTMNAELTRVRGLVENLMVLARADASDRTTSRGDVDLDDLVDDEVQRLRSTGDKAVQVSLEPVRVRADAQQVAQPLRNLVDNAQRHARSTVRIALRRSGGDAVIHVDNDGPPIPAADRERVFERFVRLDDSRSRDAGGSGLGLAIARAGIRAESGEVRVVDAPDGWCRFELRLPAEDPAL